MLFVPLLSAILTLQSAATPFPEEILRNYPLIYSQCTPCSETNYTEVTSPDAICKNRDCKGPWLFIGLQGTTMVPPTVNPLFIIGAYGRYDEICNGRNPAVSNKAKWLFSPNELTLLTLKDSSVMSWTYSSKDIKDQTPQPVDELYKKRIYNCIESTASPTSDPTKSPTVKPTRALTFEPTVEPTKIAPIAPPIVPPPASKPTEAPSVPPPKPTRIPPSKCRPTSRPKTRRPTQKKKPTCHQTVIKAAADAHM